MPTIEEKRVYTESAGTVELAVATDLGLVVVEVSDDFVGEFGIALRESCRDVTGVDGALAVATDEDVLVAPPDAESFAPTAFGPATSVSGDDGDLVALASDGSVGRLAELRRVLATGDAGTAGTPGAPTHDGWREVGRVAGGRRLDGDLLAAEEGVYRVGDDLAHAGLADVRDVTSAGVPRCATDTGLYRLGNGWLEDRPGEFRLVAGSADGRANAVGVAGEGDGSTDGDDDDRLFAVDDGEWRPVASPVPDAVADVAYGDAATYVVSESGTLAVDAGDGWRTQALGVGGVAALTVR
jgi:hypothetical protein